MRVSPGGALHNVGGTPNVKCSVSDNSDAPRQENQLGRFLSSFGERLTRNAYVRTHGQPTR